MTSTSEIHIRKPESSPFTSPRVKPAPQAPSIPVPFFYLPSDDGTDENLLILLHGLGDTHIPFAKLGRQLKLPQTAILALDAPEQVPFLYEQAFQWYPSFDNLGEVIDRPNPTPALELLSKVLDHLAKDCSWPVNRIHLFGFAQGGSVAVEFGVKWWKLQLKMHASALTNSDVNANEDTNSLSPPPESSLGSIVTISGPLLSYPTPSALSPTPLLVVYRPVPAEPALPPGSLTAFKKAYKTVIEVNLDAKGPGMPSSKEEWEPIMRFWSERIGKRQMDGLYEVMSGSAS